MNQVQRIAAPAVTTLAARTMLTAILLTSIINVVLAAIIVYRTSGGKKQTAMTLEAPAPQIQEHSAIIDSEDLALQEFLTTAEGRNVTLNDIEEVFKK